MRHFKVDFKWKKSYNSTEFDHDCDSYDNSQIIPSSEKYNIKCDNVYISELSRSYDTFKLLELPNTPIKTNLIDEVPLRSFFKTSYRLPMAIWFVIGRIQWYFNFNRQPEKKSDTQQKIDRIIEIIENKNSDCLIIGHGIYFILLKKTLLKKNYSGNNTNHYKNGQVVEFSKIVG